MKIYVNKIPPEGLILSESCNPSELELDAEGIEFKKVVEVIAKISKSGSEIFIELEFKAPVEYTCARCLVGFEDIISKKIDLHYKAEPDETIDITEDIRQELVLDYPMKVLCKSDCKGLCPSCGQNLNIMQCECM